MCDFHIVARQRYSEGLLLVRDVRKCMALEKGFFPRWSVFFFLEALAVGVHL